MRRGRPPKYTGSTPSVRKSTAARPSGNSSQTSLTSCLLPPSLITRFSASMREFPLHYKAWMISRVSKGYKKFPTKAPSPTSCGVTLNLMCKVSASHKGELALCSDRTFARDSCMPTISYAYIGLISCARKGTHRCLISS